MDSVFTVSQITEQIKVLLEGSFSKVKVSGETSNCRPSSTGHLYFSIKDNDAMISCVMFRNRTYALDFELKDGMEIVVAGELSVYKKRGSYQIVCTSIQKTGEGKLLALLEERKRKFAHLGYFDEERKKKIPPFPKKIVVVTSPTGAALRDFLNVIHRRNAGMHIIVAPAVVQGDAAAASISSQIAYADRYKLGDVIVITRGGGSIEDLLPFSEAAVVESIFHSTTPVISAVGHEIDFALSDFASDLRAPTPSAAAELVTSTATELHEKILSFKDQIIRIFDNRIEKYKLLINQFKPENLEGFFRQFMQPILLRLDDCKESLILNFETRIKDSKMKVALHKNLLENNSPESVLSRGYSIVTDKKSGEIISSTKKLPQHKQLVVTTSDGMYDAEARGVINEKL